MKHRIKSGWVTPLDRIVRVIFSPAPAPLVALARSSDKKSNFPSYLKNPGEQNNRRTR
jgi:hypothetical protein